MATLKVSFVRHLTTLVNYVSEQMSQNDVAYAEDCHQKTAAQDFQLIAQFHHGKGEVNGIHIIQSWNKEESTMLTPSEVNDMGQELVNEHFPGHAFLVVTHTDTGNYHNHIIVNPWHTETGKKIENKKRHLHELRSTSDRICQSRGLSVLEKPNQARQMRVPDKVKRIDRFNGKSWLLDLFQKADFARHYATNHDQFIAILKEFGVEVRLENKNITYFYGGKERGKRGLKMGSKYHRPGLEAAYKVNAIKFATLNQNPEQLWQNAISKISKRSESQATPKSRQNAPLRYPHEVDTVATLIPLSELRRARLSSIFDYCRDQGIKLESVDGTGKKTLQGRPFVEIGEFEWLNKKNRTKGSLIEFVAAHKNISFLHAVSEINRNPALLALEHHHGEAKRTFTSFYIPDQNRIEGPRALEIATKLFRSMNADARHAETLFQSGQLQVTKEGKVRLFAKGDDKGALEYEEYKDKWNVTAVGKSQTPFHSVNNRSKTLTIFLDPFSFLRHQGKNGAVPKIDANDVLCLFRPDPNLISKHIAENSHIRAAHVVHGNGQEELLKDLFLTIRSRHPAISFTALSPAELTVADKFALTR